MSPETGAGTNPFNGKRPITLRAIEMRRARVERRALAAPADRLATAETPSQTIAHMHVGHSSDQLLSAVTELATSFAVRRWGASFTGVSCARTTRSTTAPC